MRLTLEDMIRKLDKKDFLEMCASGIDPEDVVKPVAESQLNADIKVLDDSVDDVAKWLFTMKYRMPNQRFYHSWHDEISACPLTEKEYRNLANEILTLLKNMIKGE